MKSREFLVAIRENGISVELKDGKLRAIPGEKARELSNEFITHHIWVEIVAKGYMQDWQGNSRKVQIECDDPGGCWRCKNWTPYVNCEGERTGLCLSRITRESIRLRGDAVCR